MANALSGSPKAAPEPHNMYLLVQEIVDEDNYDRLTLNLAALHTVCVGGTDRVRLIFSDEPPASVSERVFEGLDHHSKVTLVLLSNSGFSPACLLTARSDNTLQRTEAASRP